MERSWWEMRLEPLETRDLSLESVKIVLLFLGTVPEQAIKLGLLL